MPYNGRGVVRRTLAERFWEKVIKAGPEDCWEWTARKCPLGYGRLWMDGRARLAHHVSCVLHGIPIPGYPKSKYVIDHKCRNRGCVNPGHFRTVLQGDNANKLADRSKALERARATRAANRARMGEAR